MKRICSLFLTLLMILALSVPAGAVNNDIPSEKIIDGRSVYSFSMDEIQDLLLDFFEENNISLEPIILIFVSCCVVTPMKNFALLLTGNYFMLIWRYIKMKQNWHIGQTIMLAC